jgi:hypothetical protein
MAIKRRRVLPPHYRPHWRSDRGLAAANANRTGAMARRIAEYNRAEAVRKAAEKT